MHPVRPQLRALAEANPAYLEIRHVPPFDADGSREFAAEHVCAAHAPTATRTPLRLAGELVLARTLVRERFGTQTFFGCSPFRSLRCARAVPAGRLESLCLPRASWPPTATARGARRAPRVRYGGDEPTTPARRAGVASFLKGDFGFFLKAEKDHPIFS